MDGAPEHHGVDPAKAAGQDISRSVISLHKERFGRGAVAGKTYLHDDAVFVVLNDGHTAAEETLLAGGGAADVASQRVRTSAAIEEELAAIVERATGRKVSTVMTTSKQDPSVIAFVFVLEHHEVLKAVPAASADE